MLIFYVMMIDHTIIWPINQKLVLTSIMLGPGHSIPVDEDHPAQGLAVDPLYFRISILPRWQIPWSAWITAPSLMIHSIPCVFINMCMCIDLHFFYWKLFLLKQKCGIEPILTKIGIFYLFGINFSSCILKNNAQLNQKLSLHSLFF